MLRVKVIKIIRFMYGRFYLTKSEKEIKITMLHMVKSLVEKIQQNARSDG
jgi:hypothetical protein